MLALSNKFSEKNVLSVEANHKDNFFKKLYDKEE